jgi:hypothetical protein
MRKVSERQSVDSPQGKFHSAGHLTGPLFGTLFRHKHDIEKARRLSLMVPALQSFQKFRSEQN